MEDTGTVLGAIALIIAIIAAGFVYVNSDAVDLSPIRGDIDDAVDSAESRLRIFVATQIGDVDRDISTLDRKISLISPVNNNDIDNFEDDIEDFEDDLDDVEDDVNDLEAKLSCIKGAADLTAVQACI